MARFRMDLGQDETAETAHGLNPEALPPSHAADVSQPKLIKAHLTQLLIARVGLNKLDAQAMVDGLFELITQALGNGVAVGLSGFGCFQLRDKRARPGRNLKTGTAIPIAARRVVLFHASRTLKLRLCGGRYPDD
jgi:integration host factor subunit alpha